MHLGRPAANTGTLLMKGPPMNEKNLPAAQPPGEPSPWLDIADELERIAADCRDLVGEPAPSLFYVSVQPGRPDDPERAKRIDAAARVLLNKRAETERNGLGSSHYSARGHRGPIGLSVHGNVADPEDPGAELERLREENARLRAAAGLDHSRDEPVDAHGGRVPPHLEDGRRPGEAAEGERPGWHASGCQGASGLPCTCTTQAR